MTDPYHGFDPEFAAASDWARLYRANGVQIVPCKNKVPRLKSWKEYQNCLVPDLLFEKWYGHNGEFSQSYDMGMLTGLASGRILMIDLDIYKAGGHLAIQWWQNVLAVHNNGFDLETWKQHTGGGGVQMFFLYPDNWKFAVNAKTSINVDVRCQGGFAVLPPTQHASGRPYEWDPGCAPWELDLAIAPDWLLTEVERLIAEHGGGVGNSGNGQSRNNANSGNGQFGQFDAFGHQTDGRETAMYRMVWRCVVQWHRQCPIKPPSAESAAKSLQDYAVYERGTRPQQWHPDDMGLTASLDAEGRGWIVWQKKWHYAMSQWEDDVAIAARHPDPSPERDYNDFNHEFEAEPKLDPTTGQPLPLILTAEQFIAGFRPPAYIVDGIIQRGYLYSLTARTGHGKTAVAMYIAQCIARGQMVHGKSVKSGTVLLLAGENPDDIRARFLVLAHHYGFDPARLKMRFVAGVIDIATSMPRILAEVADIDDLVMVIVDTAAAYFPGDETNSNSQQGAYARLLRQLTFLPGKPAVLACCHPIKNATRDNLLPMGGSAFLNEVDGNLTLWANAEKQVSLHWLGKFRGPEFNPIAFGITIVSTETVKDAEGRLMPNAVAEPISDATLQAAEQIQESDEDQLLRLIYKFPKASFAELAERMNFVVDGEPTKWKIQRIMERLRDDRLIVKHRGGKYRLTSKGKTEIGVETGGENGVDFG